MAKYIFSKSTHLRCVQFPWLVARRLKVEGGKLAWKVVCLSTLGLFIANKIFELHLFNFPFGCRSNVGLQHFPKLDGIYVMCILSSVFLVFSILFFSFYISLCSVRMLVMGCFGFGSTILINTVPHMRKEFSCGGRIKKCLNVGKKIVRNIYLGKQRKEKHVKRYNWICRVKFYWEEGSWHT